MNPEEILEEARRYMRLAMGTANLDNVPMLAAQAQAYATINIAESLAAIAAHFQRAEAEAKAEAERAELLDYYKRGGLDTPPTHTA